MENEESAEEDYLSSAPESDYDTPANRHFEQPARVSANNPLGFPLPVNTGLVQSTPSQTQAHPALEGPPSQFGLPSMPVIIQEAPQSGTQAPSEFDLVAAQSRGKPIAPRQPPMQQSLPVEVLDDGHSHHLLPQPPPPPPDLRSTQRLKRGRDVETNGTPDSPSDSHLGKRRKHPAGPVGAPPILGNTSVMGSTGEGYMPPFNPTTSQPILPAPSRVPQESDLDNLCIQLRDAFRIMKAGYEEEQRARHELYEAALGRANARVVQFQQKIDDISEESAVRLKDLSLSRKLESEHRERQYDSLQADNLRMRDDYTRTRDLNAQIRDENAKLREQSARQEERIAALSAALEEERRTKPSEPSDRPKGRSVRDVDPPLTPEDNLRMSPMEKEFYRARRNAQLANAANDLLAEEMSGLRSDHAETRRKFEEAEAVHDHLTLAVEELAAKDFGDITKKLFDKNVLGVKEAGQQLASKFKEVEGFLNKLEHLAPNDTQQPTKPNDNTPSVQDQRAERDSYGNWCIK